MISFNNFNQPKEPVFYTRLPKLYERYYLILGIIFNTITVNLLFKYTSDYFFNRKYYLNRRLLLKYIESLMFCEYTPFKIQDSKIDCVNSIYNFDTFFIIIYNEGKNINNREFKGMNVTVHLDLEKYLNSYDIIGLFYSSKKEDKIVKDIILLLKGLTVKQDENRN